LIPRTFANEWLSYLVDFYITTIPQWMNLEHLLKQRAKYHDVSVDEVEPDRLPFLDARVKKIQVKQGIVTQSGYCFIER